MPGFRKSRQALLRFERWKSVLPDTARGLIVLLPAAITITFIAAGRNATAQTVPAVWTVSSTHEFEEGITEGVSVIRDRGGAVRIALPVVNVTAEEDYSRVLERDYDFVGSRNAGETLVQTYNDRDWVYARILDADDHILADSIKANDERCGRDSRCSHSRGGAAVLNNGWFVLAWRVQIDGIGYRTMAQVFDADHCKVGSNITTFEHATSQTTSDPTPFAFDDSARFWIVHSVGSFNDGRRLVVEKVDLTGQMVGAPVPLNPIRLTFDESGAALDQLDDGSLVVTWSGATGNSAETVDAYARRFSRALVPLSDAVRLNELEEGSQGVTAVRVAPDGTYMVVWYEGWATGTSSSTYAISGQFFDRAGWRTGPGFRLSEGNEQMIFPTVSLDADVFDVSWTAFDEIDREYYGRYSSWRLEPSNEGTYVSSVFDSGSLDTDFLDVDCDAEYSGVSAIRFQIRTALSPKVLDSSPWRAPRSGLEGASDPCVLGLELNPSFDQNRYMQFKAEFVTGDYARSPILKGVYVHYDAGTHVEAAEFQDSNPERSVLAPPWPNPSSGEVHFSFSVAGRAQARIEIFDPLGRRVDVPFVGIAGRGTQIVDWLPSDRAPGLYHARLRVGNDVVLRSFVVY